MTDRGRKHGEAVRAAVEAQATGRFGLALELFGEARELAEALCSKPAVHAARINISSCLLSLGDHAGAREGLAAIILESEEPQHRA